MTGAAALAFFLILLAIVSGIGNYGATGILRYSHPVLELSRKANLPFLMQTFGLFFGATWLSQTLVAVGFFYFLLSEGTAQWLRVLNYKWFTLILFPPVSFLTMLLSNVIEMRIVFPYLRVGGFFFTVGLVLLLVVVAALRRGGNRKNAS